MACLRDLQHLFHPRQPASSSSQPSNPFYAGFGNRITDALSYRSVGIPSSRIFTINSNAEVIHSHPELPKNIADIGANGIIGTGWV